MKYQTLEFNGKQELWGLWSVQFKAKSHQQGFIDLLDPKVQEPNPSDTKFPDFQKKKQDGYYYLLL